LFFICSLGLKAWLGALRSYDLINLIPKGIGKRSFFQKYLNFVPFFSKRGLKLSWFLSAAVTFICKENDSDNISFKPKLT
jgi:hypothetical protein